MALTNSQYDAIMREYEYRQNRNRHLLDERTAFIYKNVDGYRELSESIAAISVSQGRKLLEGDDYALEDLRTSLRSLSSMKDQLLTGAGYPADYLAPIYDCPDCKDTGYINGVKCHCFRQAVIDLLYEQSGIRDMLEKENFSMLSYDYYQGEDLERFGKTVNACRNFIKTFDTDYQNLFFYGTVGTGKSFLSGCIAKELIESGHSVIYFSAAGLFETISRNMFDYKLAQVEKKINRLFHRGILKNKKIYLYNDIYEPLADELLAWECICLKGDIEKIIFDIKQDDIEIEKTYKQLSLFEDFNIL